MGGQGSSRSRPPGHCSSPAQISRSRCISECPEAKPPAPSTHRVRQWGKQHWGKWHQAALAGGLCIIMGIVGPVSPSPEDLRSPSYCAFPRLGGRAERVRTSRCRTPGSASSRPAQKTPGATHCHQAQRHSQELTSAQMWVHRLKSIQSTCEIPVVGAPS